MQRLPIVIATICIVAMVGVASAWGTVAHDGVTPTIRQSAAGIPASTTPANAGEDNGDHSETEEANWAEYLRRPQPSAETLRGYFSDAAKEFAVPVSILEAIGQVETNWTQIGPSIDQGWGIMHLVENPICHSLGDAADLLALDPQVLKDDVRQNIRGGAAVLAKYAGPHRTTFATEADWFPAIKAYTCLVDDKLRTDEALLYYKVVKYGIRFTLTSGESVTLPAHPSAQIPN